MDMGIRQLEHEYTEEGFFKNLAECFYHRIIKKRRLLVCFTIDPIGKGDKYQRREIWTDKTPAQINRMGYLESKGLHDTISFLGTKIYAKVENGQEFDIEKYYPEKKDTAYTLNDAMLSDSDARFKKALARAQLGATADWQKIALIGGVGILAVILTKYFGIW